MKLNLLLVDDNEKYKNLILGIYSSNDYEIIWVKSAALAKQAVQEKGINFFHTIVTDITMETQISGLLFAVGLRKKGFQGKIIIASTGFDFPIIAALAKTILAWFGINEIIPKVSLKQGNPKILVCKKESVN